MSNVADVKDSAYYIGEFGGEKRYVKYDLNAFAVMEEKYGSMEKANEALASGSMIGVRRMLWIGLIHDQAIFDEVTGEPIRYKLTEYEVGSWLTPSNMKDVMGKLEAAIKASVPQEDAEVNNESNSGEIKPFPIQQ